MHSKWIFRQGTAEALDQGNGTGLGRLAGEPGFFDQVSSEASVDDAKHLAHYHHLGGTVIADGVSLPLAQFDNVLDSWLRTHFGFSSGLLLSGTLFALLFALTVRFLAVALQAVDSGLATIRPDMDDSARSLGFRPLEVLRKIHIPILRTSLLTAGLLVFVDVLKELPATLVLRPFNFNTLAVRAYEMASDERLQDAALPALAIMLAGLIPVIVLSRSIAESRASHSQ